MRAVVLHEHGGLENLVYQTNYREPEMGPGDVILKVVACALNYHDVFTRKGNARDQGSAAIDHRHRCGWRDR